MKFLLTILLSLSMFTATASIEKKEDAAAKYMIDMFTSRTYFIYKKNIARALVVAKRNKYGKYVLKHLKCTKASNVRKCVYDNTEKMSETDMDLLAYRTHLFHKRLDVNGFYKQTSTHAARLVGLSLLEQYEKRGLVIKDKLKAQMIIEDSGFGDYVIKRTGCKKEKTSEAVALCIRKACAKMSKAELNEHVKISYLYSLEIVQILMNELKKHKLRQGRRV